MGVGIPGAIHLAKLKQRERFTGSILTLGVQDTQLTRRALLDLGKRYGFGEKPKGWRPEINPKEIFGKKRFLTGKSLFQFLGFEDVQALDADGFEEAEVIHDLNLPEPPPELRDRFDVVFDGGTLEHVFHLPNALANLHAMTKPGGLIIHQSPSSNHPDHGFYMFSPTFFYDYYSANGYEIVDSQFFMYPKDSVKEPTWWMDYYPGALKGIAHGGFGVPGMSFAVAFAARKSEAATHGKIPQQGWYEQEWRRAEEERKTGGKAKAESGE